jgi:hypothetical protein
MTAHAREGPREDATGAFYGARRPALGAEGGVGAFGKRRKNYCTSGSFDPLRRKSLYRDRVGRRRGYRPP